MYGFLLILLSAIDEGYRLCTGAGSVRAECRCRGSVGYAFGNRPCDGLGAPCVCRNIGKPELQIRRIISGCAVQEHNDLCTGADGVGTEGRVRRALGDAVFNSPHYCLVVHAAFAYVGKRIIHVLHLGRACRAVQEGDYLGACAAVIGSKSILGLTVCYAVCVCPEYRIVISVALNVLERIVARILFAADRAYTVNVIVAGGFDRFALLDGLAADSADLVAGVAVLGAACSLGVFKLGLEAGDRFVSDFELLAFSEILGVDVMWLLTGKESNRN